MDPIIFFFLEHMTQLPIPGRLPIGRTWKLVPFKIEKQPSPKKKRQTKKP